MNCAVRVYKLGPHNHNSLSPRGSASMKSKKRYQSQCPCSKPSISHRVEIYNPEDRQKIVVECNPMDLWHSPSPASSLFHFPRLV
jgi:hypothetical protein